MPVRAGALGHFGDARRAAVGSALVERVVETGSLVIRKLGGTRAREIAIHRFLSAPSVTCGEMVETPEPSFTVELTDDQARIVAEIAQAHGMKPDAVLIEAIGHGLAMIVAGVNNTDLAEPGDGPQEPPSKRKRKAKMPTLTEGKGGSDMGDDIPF